jgi:hypothetical protein
MTRLASHRLLITAIALCMTVAATAAFATTANADVVPAHSYSVRCTNLDYWGNRIIAQPIHLDVQQGVGQSLVDGTGTQYGTTQQLVYFVVWAYSYKYGGWYHSTTKRVLDGYPNNGVQEYDWSRHQWWQALGGIDAEDLAVGSDAVSLRPSTGSGLWFIEVQTYWAPPFLGTPDSTSPAAAPGGLNTYDQSTYCSF